MQDIEHVMGKVTAKDATANTITIQGGGSDGKQFMFTVDANTVYEHFDDAGLQNAFASVAVGQLLKADLKLGTAGALLATVVELQATPQETFGRTPRRNRFARQPHAVQDGRPPGVA
jgi:hypothetical protein